jgi:SAM-dependent methyltransferase
VDTQRHWDEVYAARTPDRVSWYRPHLDRSLDLIDSVKMPLDAPLIDIGGGASTLADDLLARGYTDVTVLDVSKRALRVARARLGDRAARVKWIRADINDATLPEPAFRLWHDRAVFHFLLDADARARYIAAVRRSVAPGGYVLISTFGPNAPERCSGLPVSRYDADALHAELGSDFVRIADSREVHTTPSGMPQEFVYGLFRRS